MRDTGQLKRDLADFTDEQFEQFIDALVRARYPERKVERLAAPDGGADVLVWKSGTAVEVVYQVKHYPADINWSKCEESLARARRRWTPEAIVFAFPRNLSAPLIESFRERLQDTSEIPVGRYTLSDIAADLDEHPRLFDRYFQHRLRSQDDLVRAVLAAARQGNEPLKSGKDLVDRAMGLSEFLDSSDPSFEYAVSAGLAGRSRSFGATDGQTPYMTARVSAGAISAVPSPCPLLIASPRDTTGSISATVSQATSSPGLGMTCRIAKVRRAWKRRWRRSASSDCRASSCLPLRDWWCMAREP